MIDLRIETVVLLAVTFICIEAKLNYIPPCKNPSPYSQLYDYEQSYPLPPTVDSSCAPSPSAIPWLESSSDFYMQEPLRSYPGGRPTPPLPTIPLGYESWPATSLNTNFQYTQSPSTCCAAQPSAIPYSVSCKTPCRPYPNCHLTSPLRTKFRSMCHNSKPPCNTCNLTPLLLSPLFPSTVPQCAIPPPMPGPCRPGYSSWLSHRHI